MDWGGRRGVFLNIWYQRYHSKSKLFSGAERTHTHTHTRKVRGQILQVGYKEERLQKQDGVGVCQAPVKARTTATSWGAHEVPMKTLLAVCWSSAAIILAFTYSTTSTPHSASFQAWLGMVSVSVGHARDSSWARTSSI